MSFPPKGFSTQWWAAVIDHVYNKPAAHKLYLTDSIVSSLIIAVSATAVAVLTGILAAYALVRYSFRGKSMLEPLFMLPLTSPYVIIGVSLLVLFSAFKWGTTYERLIWGHIIVCFPFVLRNCVATLQQVGIQTEEAALTLGANRIQAFLRVTLPLMRLGVVSGTILSFLISFGMFSITFFLYTGDVRPFPMWLWEYLWQMLKPEIAAIASAVILGTVIVLMIMDRLVGIGRAMTV